MPPKRARWASTASRAAPRVTDAPSVRVVRRCRRRVVVVRACGRAGHGGAPSCGRVRGGPPADHGVDALVGHRDKRREDHFARTGDARRRGGRDDGAAGGRGERRGSRPDGWWRDRAGATARLLGRLAARRAPADRAGRRSRRAPRSSPSSRGRRATSRRRTACRSCGPRAAGTTPWSACAARAGRSGEPVLVVTADRGLRARLPAGVAVSGPGWLLRPAGRGGRDRALTVPHARCPRVGGSGRRAQAGAADGRPRPALRS